MHALDNNIEQELGEDLNRTHNKIKYYHLPPLHLAVIKFERDIVEILLNKGADVINKHECYKNENIFKTKHFLKYLKIGKKLLENGGSIDSNSTDMYPLHFAITLGCKEMLQLLIENNVCVNTGSVDNMTPVYIKPGQFGEACTIRLDHPKFFHKEVSLHTYIWRQCVQNYTPLHLACMYTNEKIMQLLIAKISLVINNNIYDIQDVKGRTPLHSVCEEGNLYAVMLLVENGATIDIKNNQQETPLMVAARLGRDDIVEYLLENGADANSTNYCNKTVLFVATRRCGVRAIEALLKYGADPNKSYCGEYPLYEAIRWNSTARIRLLINSGANVQIVDSSGCTLLHRSADYPEITYFLLSDEIPFSERIDINAQNKRGETVLHNISARSKHLFRSVCVELLLKQNADVSLKNKWGYTPLMYAIQFANQYAVDSLLKYGADVNIKCMQENITPFESGYTPLMYAIQFENQHAVDTLLEYGADVNIKCMEENITPFESASSYRTRSSTSSKICFILHKHITMLLAAKLHVHEDHIQLLQETLYADFRNNEIRNFENRCDKEIADMKRKIISYGISFYDLLTKDVHQTALYLRNSFITETLHAGAYKQLFPIYGNMISLNLDRGLKRYCMLILSKLMLLNVTTIGNCNWPEFIIEQIFSYLSDNDLHNIIRALYPIKRKQTIAKLTT